MLSHIYQQGRIGSLLDCHTCCHWKFAIRISDVLLILQPPPIKHHSLLIYVGQSAHQPHHSLNRHTEELTCAQPETVRFDSGVQRPTCYYYDYCDYDYDYFQ